VLHVPATDSLIGPTSSHNRIVEKFGGGESIRNTAGRR
jgi:hypothetical protein